MDVPAGFEFSFKCPMKETAGFLCTRLGCYGDADVLAVQHCAQCACKLFTYPNSCQRLAIPVNVLF